MLMQRYSQTDKASATGATVLLDDLLFALMALLAIAASVLFSATLLFGPGPVEASDDSARIDPMVSAPRDASSTDAAAVRAEALNAPAGWTARRHGSLR